MRGAKHAGGARPNHYDIKLFHLSLTYQNHNRDKKSAILRRFAAGHRQIHGGRL